MTSREENVTLKVRSIVMGIMAGIGVSTGTIMTILFATVQIAL